MENQEVTYGRKKPKAPRVRVEVTEAIIKESVKADSSHCMIAEAVKRAFPGAKAVSVDIQTIRFSDQERGFRYVYLTPRVAQVPLIQFDQGVEPAPFRFTLMGAHVVRMGRRFPKADSPSSTKAQRDALKKARHVYHEMANAQLVSRNGGEKQIEVVGGRTPPTTAFSKRRSFGLKALGSPTW